MQLLFVQPQEKKQKHPLWLIQMQQQVRKLPPQMQQQVWKQVLKQQMRQVCYHMRSKPKQRSKPKTKHFFSSSFFLVQK